MEDIKRISKIVSDNLVIKDITVTINYFHHTVNITCDGGVIISHITNDVDYQLLKEELKRKRYSFVQSSTFEETYLADYQSVISGVPKPKTVTFTIEA
jgi:hypothetical protein